MIAGLAVALLLGGVANGVVPSVWQLEASHPLLWLDYLSYTRWVFCLARQVGFFELEQGVGRYEHRPACLAVYVHTATCSCADLGCYSVSLLAYLKLRQGLPDEATVLLQAQRRATFGCSLQLCCNCRYMLHVIYELPAESSTVLLPMMWAVLLLYSRTCSAVWSIVPMPVCTCRTYRWGLQALYISWLIPASGPQAPATATFLSGLGFCGLQPSLMQALTGRSSDGNSGASTGVSCGGSS